jgi:hypothetical protein
MWNEGLQDAWRHEKVADLASNIKTLADLTQIKMKPWSKEDISINKLAEENCDNTF